MVAARSWRTEAGLYSRFTEGLQSLDLKEITALLDEFEPIGRSPETSLQGRAPRVSFQEVVPSPISGGWEWSPAGPGAPEPTLRCGWSGRAVPSL